MWSLDLNLCVFVHGGKKPEKNEKRGDLQGEGRGKRTMLYLCPKSRIKDC